MTVDQIESKVRTILAQRGFIIPANQMNIHPVTRQDLAIPPARIEGASLVEIMEDTRPSILPEFQPWAMSQDVAMHGFTDWPETDEATLVEMYLYAAPITEEEARDPDSLSDDQYAALCEPVTRFFLIPETESPDQETTFQAMAELIYHYFTE